MTYGKAILLLGDSQAAGGTFSGPSVPTGGLRLDAAEVWNGQAWVTGDPLQAANATTGVGLFGGRIAEGLADGPCDTVRVHRAVTPGQGIANLTSPSSAAWTALQAAVDASWIYPADAVYWGGANDAHESIGVEPYRSNLHRLWQRSRELGCVRMYVVLPNSAVVQAGSTIANVRKASLLFARDRGAEVTIVNIDDVWGTPWEEPGGPHLSPVGMLYAGRRVVRGIKG